MSRRRLAQWLIGALALLLFGGLAILAVQRPVFHLDVAASQTIQRATIPGLRTIMLAVSEVGHSPTSLLIVAVTAALVGRWLGARAGLFALLLAPAQLALNELFKRTIGRPRPTEELVEIILAAPGLSFPSGHVMFFAIYFGFLAYLLYTRLPSSWPRNAALLLLGALVLLVGPSRMYVGAHWLSDVVGAYAISAIVLRLVVELFERWVGERVSPASA